MIKRLRSIFNQFQKKRRQNDREAIPVKSRIESFPEFFFKKSISAQTLATGTEWHININSDIGTTL